MIKVRFSVLDTAKEEYVLHRETSMSTVPRVGDEVGLGVQDGEGVYPVSLVEWHPFGDSEIGEPYVMVELLQGRPSDA